MAMQRNAEAIVQSIGELMKAGRVALGYTAPQMARLVEKTEAQISKYENGHTDPGPDVRSSYVRFGVITAEEGHAPFRVDESAA